MLVLATYCCRVSGPANGGNGNAGFPTLEWFMLPQASRTSISGGSTGPFSWDNTQFMNTAVIYGLKLEQSYAAHVVGYVGSVRAYAGDYDYTWVFK